MYINFLLHKHEQIKTSLFPFCGFIYLFILRQLNLFWTLNLLISQIRPYDLKLVILLLPHLSCCNDSHILPNSVSYNHLKRVFFWIRRLKDLPYGDHEAVLHTVIRSRSNRTLRKDALWAEALLISQALLCLQTWVLTFLSSFPGLSLSLLSLTAHMPASVGTNWNGHPHVTSLDHSQNYFTKMARG